MEIKSVIFVFSAFLLVPIVYATSFVPEVCAAPKDPNWGKGGECRTIEVDNARIMECCWKEPDINNPGETITWCQRCADNGHGECGPVYLKPATPSTGIPPSGAGGGVLQDPSTGSDPKESKGGFLGDLKNKITSQSNTSSSNATK